MQLGPTSKYSEVNNSTIFWDKAHNKTTVTGIKKSELYNF